MMSRGTHERREQHGLGDFLVVAKYALFLIPLVSQPRLNVRNYESFAEGWMHAHPPTRVLGLFGVLESVRRFGV